MGWKLLGLAALAGILGCPAISTSLQQQADRQVTFAELAAHPEQYQGRLVILGGEVKSVQPHEGGSLLTVTQKDPDPDLRPLEGKPSLDTFVVESAQQLPPKEYVPLRKVTVAGIIQGGQHETLLVEARKIHLWEFPNSALQKCPPELRYWLAPPYYEALIPGGRR